MEPLRLKEGQNFFYYKCTPLGEKDEMVCRLMKQREGVNGENEYFV